MPVANMTAEEKLRRAFDNIYDQHPFLASTVASWKVYESKRIPTAATNGPQMFWNREFIDKCTISETTGLIYHEAAHVFLLHHLRFEGIEAPKWNVAADLALNWYCREFIPNKIGGIQICVPGQSTFSDLPTGKDAEWYYAELKKKQKQQGQGQPQKGEGQSQNGPSDKSDQSQGEKEQSEGSGGGDKEEEQENSEGNNSTEPNLPKDYQPGDQPGEVLPYPGEITEEVVQEWEQRTATAINTALGQGNAPGFIKELAESLIGGKSKVNWKAELRRFMTKYAPIRYSYLKPNRRSSWRKDLILQGRKSRTCAPGFVYEDTSGSMDEDQHNRGLNELRGILEAYQYVEVDHGQGDTQLYWENVRHYNRWNLDELKTPQEWIGRGGTELGGGLKEIAATGKYSWIVVISDMIWSVADVEDVGVPVFWLMTSGKPSNERYLPKFGIAIELPKEA